MSQFAAQDLVEAIGGGLQYRHQLVGNRNQPPGSAFVVEATVDDEAVDPGFETGIASKITDRREELEEGVLGDIHGERPITGKTQGYGIYLIFVRLEQRAESVALSTLTGCDEFPIRSFQHHSRHATTL